MDRRAYLAADEDVLLMALALVQQSAMQTIK